MGRSKPPVFRMPDEQGFAEIVRDCGLSPSQLVQLRSTLDEVAGHCKGIGTAIASREIKEALGVLDRALKRMQGLLKESDIAAALDAIETHGAMGHLLSSTVACELTGEDKSEVDFADVENLVAHKRWRGEPLRPSDLDALCVLDRQRAINQATARAMQLAINQMRIPISNWLYLAGQDKGGNRPQTDREWLILLLARDTQQLIAGTPSSQSGSPFFKLCTAVLGACGFDDSGYEEAVQRCLKKHDEWLAWNRIPLPTDLVRQAPDHGVDATPDDPEPELTC